MDGIQGYIKDRQARAFRIHVYSKVETDAIEVPFR